MNCEICGAFEENLLRTEVEGAVMNLCKNCSKYGRVIGTAVQTSKPVQRTVESERQLKYDYINEIKHALQESGLSIEDAAEKINCSPKDLKKVVNGEILPDEKITIRLERLLKISLYEMNFVSDSTFKKDTEQLSFGDVVDIKRSKK
ncbi:MAG: multiprotein-bridging factor 1 family protein [Candidatus Parvarchaeota archaeon]|jgi:putative transcription factor|nr:multiprotein-bridging factor 1 family protein [Candidatus Parvarchaeota archaeon]MCW1294984.1 multiprotein-bridging factor 1 family protein [Candidatus Parvarchaeum tengchongense]MCW1295479.1 multiprotein-bridging factor 1 family protein [Candidatus Parvarchaeum tengchongense]MCW1299463.1 multiprotein-bridging factor 1 family protein [Candidatus Parvarchaeum tengchongense]MCW1312584.1 multiprotein-bridging factor 1 family protein [Candidatus Parvarchaeum tengchongense]